MLFGKPAQDDAAPSLSRRQRRAEALRRQALSPVRILIMVLALPLTTALVGAGVFLRASDYEPNEAVIHLIALAGCDAAHAVGFGPFRKGQRGYHKRNDPDGDGVACETTRPTVVQHAGPRHTETPKERSVGTAKFVRP